MLTTVTNEMQRVSPESQGIASSAILQFVEAVERGNPEFHSFMLLRHGKVVAEGWWSPYGRDIPHWLFSLSKSFTSTAVGFAVTEGLLSVEDLVLSFFPDEAPAEKSENLASMRVRHLLAMCTGHDEDTMPHMAERPDGNWIKGFFNVPVLHQPGTHFLYNTGATYMLSAIIQKLTGMKLVDYLEPRLFEPLGIKNATWQESPQGINVGGWGLTIKTEDIARFGQLYLQNGMWEGSRILPEAWVKEATSFHISNGEGLESDWAQGYGYQFWRCRHNAYRGDGAFGQYCVIMPEQDAVLAITSGLPDMQIPLNLVWDLLLPAMREHSLPDDTAAHDNLKKKLSGLTIAPVQGEAASPTARKISGRTYKVMPNELSVETVALKCSGSDCTVTVKTAAVENTITCGYGSWHPGETTLFNEPQWVGAMQIVASGAWTADDTFTMIVRLYETPFSHTVVFHFNGDEMTVETRVNVSFFPIKTLVLAAQST